jgi:hypothetical protein
MRVMSCYLETIGHAQTQRKKVHSVKKVVRYVSIVNRR